MNLTFVVMEIGILVSFFFRSLVLDIASPTLASKHTVAASFSINDIYMYKSSTAIMVHKEKQQISRRRTILSANKWFKGNGYQKIIRFSAKCRMVRETTLQSRIDENPIKRNKIHYYIFITFLRTSLLGESRLCVSLLLFLTCISFSIIHNKKKKMEILLLKGYLHML